MSTFLGFFRGINVGGHGVVPMTDLRAWLTRLGFAEVRSLLQSGNFVFRSTRRSPAALERHLESAAEKQLGLRTTVFIRTPDEWRDAIAQNPFPDEAQRDPSHLVLVVMKTAPQPKQVDALQASIKGREIVRARGRHAYIYYPDNIGKSRLTLPVIERGLGATGTGRSWGTVLKMAALTASDS